jgi:hypothetical protein
MMRFTTAHSAFSTMEMTLKAPLIIWPRVKPKLFILTVGYGTLVHLHLPHNFTPHGTFLNRITALATRLTDLQALLAHPFDLYFVLSDVLERCCNKPPFDLLVVLARSSTKPIRILHIFTPQGYFKGMHTLL